MDALQRAVGGDAGGRARSWRPCTPWSPTTSTRRSSSAPGLLDLHPRVGGPRPAVARLLPRARPDAALRVHEDGAADPPVVPTPGALGPQVAPAPRAARPAARDVSRRHDHRHPPRPGGRRPVHDHDGLLRSSNGVPDGSARVVPRLLDGPHRRVARRLDARPAPAARRSHRGRALPRVHGRRDRRRSSGSTTCAGMQLTDQARAEIAALQARPPEGQGGPGRLRPPPRLLHHARGGPFAFRRLSRPFPRTRRRSHEHRSDRWTTSSTPARAKSCCVPSTTIRPTRWPKGHLPLRRHAPRRTCCSPDTGRVIVNTGMGYEAPHHRRVFDAIRPGPTHYIVTTQGHVDHLGGVDLFKEAGTVYIAQANNPACQADDARIRDTAHAHGGHLVRHARHRCPPHSPGEPGRVDAPVGTGSRRHVRRTARALRSTACEIELVAAVGETIDSLIVWLPERRTALVSNLFGPLFPHFPNLNTIRGDRYRFVEPYLESVQQGARNCGPKCSSRAVTNRSSGAELIEASLERLSRRGRLRARAGPRRVQRRGRRLDAHARDPAPARAPCRPGLRQGLLGGAHPLGELRGMVQASDRPRSSIPTPLAMRSPTW